MKTAYQPVKRPPNTIIQPKGNYKYVYMTKKKVYIKDKGYNINKRECIGRLCTDDETMMVPNGNFYIYFPDLINMDVPQDRADYIKTGMYVLVKKIMEDLQLNDIMDPIYDYDSSSLKDICQYVLISEDNVMQYFPDFGYDHALFSDQIFSDSTISRIYERHSKAEHELFLEAWCTLNKTKERVWIAYDGTNMNTCAQGVELAEYGYAKEDDDIPIVNTSYAISQENGRPLFYEVTPGSLIDNSQCTFMIDRAKSYGFENCGFIIDRGYFSEKNMNYFEENGYEFLMMVKKNSLLIQQQLITAIPYLNNSYNSYIQTYDVYGNTYKMKVFEKDTKEKYVHVYLDKHKAADQSSYLLAHYNDMRSMLDKNIEKKTTTRKENSIYEKLFYLTYDNYGYLKSYKDNEEKMRKQLRECGVFVLISSEEMSAEEALRKYRTRDSDEKLIRSMKSYLGGVVYRIYDDKRLETKSLMTFVSLILRQEIYTKTRKLNEKDNKKYTVPAIIKELEKLYMIANSKGEYRLPYALTNHQKAIYKCFGIDEVMYRKEVSLLAERYNKSQDNK